MRGPVLASLLGLVAGLATCGFVVAAPAEPPPGTFDGCPRGSLALPSPAASYAPAARGAVMRFVRGTFARTISRKPEKLIGARAGAVVLVRDWLPSGWIESECGKAVWERSLAVGVYFPALDLPHNPVGRCADCDHITFLASRTAAGWTVWGDY
jgi:hypothetical protein